MTKKVITIYKGVYDHIHAIDEVSMSTYLDRRAHKRKVPKWLPFENSKSD